MNNLSVAWRRAAPFVLAFPLASCRSAPARRELTPDERAEGGRALTLLSNAMNAGEADTRSAAALEFGRIGNPGAQALLLRALNDFDDEVKVAAAYSLWQLGQDAGLETVRELLDRRPPEPGADDPLLQAKAERMKKAQALAVKAYAAMAGPAALPVLNDLVTDPKREGPVREAAAVALTRLGRPLTSPIRALEKTAESAYDRDDRMRALQALGEVRDPTAIDTLKRAAGGSDRDVARTAFDALGRQGSLLALPDILSALTDADDRLRRSAARALSQLNSRSAAPSLQALLSEPLPFKLYGWLGLRRLGLEAPPGVPEEAAQAADPDDRLEAIPALELEGKKALPALQALLDDPSEKVRLRAAAAVLVVLRKAA